MKVYELRSEVTEMDLPLAITYLKPLISSIIPIAVVYFLVNKKYTIVILLTFVQLFLFSFGGHKTTLFYLVLAVLVYYFYTYKANRLIVIFLLILNIVPFIEMHYTDSFSMLAGMFQRRNMFAVNLISYQYYDFFSENEFDYLRQSILGRIGLESPYPRITRMMSQMYAGTDGGLNNGLCGDAYMNFGWKGLLIYPLLINIALRFFDACSRGLNYKIVVAVSIIFSTNFINSFFFTIMLTHGFIAICLFLYFTPRKENGLIKQII